MWALSHPEQQRPVTAQRRRPLAPRACPQCVVRRKRPFPGGAVSAALGPRGLRRGALRPGAPQLRVPSGPPHLSWSRGSHRCGVAAGWPARQHPLRRQRLGLQQQPCGRVLGSPALLTNRLHTGVSRDPFRRDDALNSGARGPHSWFHYEGHKSRKRCTGQGLGCPGAHRRPSIRDSLPRVFIGAHHTGMIERLGHVTELSLLLEVRGQADNLRLKVPAF